MEKGEGGERGFTGQTESRRNGRNCDCEISLLSKQDHDGIRPLSLAKNRKTIDDDYCDDDVDGDADDSYTADNDSDDDRGGGCDDDNDGDDGDDDDGSDGDSQVSKWLVGN